MHAQRGDVVSVFVEKNKTSTKLLLQAFIAVGKALEELHARGTVHGDVKSNNCTVDVLDDASVVAFPIDFGFSGKINERLPKFWGEWGDYPYMAPERWTKVKRVKEDLTYTVSVNQDVYSYCSMVRGYLICLEEEKYWLQSDDSLPMMDMLKKGLSDDPAKRPSLNEIVVSLQDYMDKVCLPQSSPTTTHTSPGTSPLLDHSIFLPESNVAVQTKKKQKTIQQDHDGLPDNEASKNAVDQALN